MSQLEARIVEVMVTERRKEAIERERERAYEVAEHWEKSQSPQPLEQEISDSSADNP